MGLERANPKYGPDRRPVGGSRTAAPSEATGRWARTALARHAVGAQRCAVGDAHRRAVARTAVEISALPDLSSAFPTMAAFGVADPRAANPGRGLTRPRQDRPVGDVHRRQFQFGEKRGAAIGPTRRGKGSKIMAIADRHGLPVACGVASASPHETQLVEATLAQRFLRAKPQRMIGDAAYDSDGLDQRLHQRHGIRLIAPHKSNRRRAQTQDGRELRRYCRRWKIERLFAWLHNFRRLVTRWEYHEVNFLAMIQLGCLVILLRHL